MSALPTIRRSVDEEGLICFAVGDSTITCWEDYPGASVRVYAGDDFVGDVEARGGFFPHGAEALGRRIARIIQSGKSRKAVERVLVGAGDAQLGSEGGS